MTAANATTISAAAHDFVGYEYKTISVSASLEGLYADSYRSFGWSLESSEQDFLSKKSILKFKRDRQIRNKAELLRLQRQFDSYADRIDSLETEPKSNAGMLAVGIGVVGCAFLAGAVFSYLGGLIVAMILLAIPGFLLWMLAYPMFRHYVSSKTSKVAPQVDAAYDAVYETAKKASSLL
ncbi:MAG: hypothetical protein ABF747_07645 [Bifidobacterium sp.]|uniref:DUF2207 domain-containing protein n=1 Tax=Bifidobacterium fermentum TaxID=3059035 RepID=A0AB39UJL5_9BIFI